MERINNNVINNNDLQPFYMPVAACANTTIALKELSPALISYKGAIKCSP